MTMQVGMVGVDGLIIAGDTRQLVEHKGRSWSTYNSSKIRIAADGGIAIACARNMDVSLRVAERVFAELPMVSVESRAQRIREIGMSVAVGSDVECIVAFRDPVPSLCVFLCDRLGDGRCDPVDRMATGDAGNPAYFWAERYYTGALNVSQLTRLAAHIVVAAGSMNNGSISGLEIVTLGPTGFRRWTDEENTALEAEIAIHAGRIGEIVLSGVAAQTGATCE